MYESASEPDWFFGITKYRTKNERCEVSIGGIIEVW
jgi:hypothetical protein